MRVLHLTAGNLFGGVETLLTTLASHRSLCSEMDPAFGLCFPGRLLDELESTKVPVFRLGAVRVSRPWTVWQARRKLGHLLQESNFDAVICHECWPHLLFGKTVRRHSIPLIFWAHDTHEGTHWVEKWARTIPPDIVLTNSGWSQSHIHNLFPNSASEILHYPILDKAPNNPGEIRRSLRAQLNTRQDAVVIIQASRLERWKGQALLLEALGQLKVVPGWECWMAGGVQRSHEGSYLAELQHSALQLGIGDRVRFLGQRADVPCLLAAADIHCQPNTGPEPFGIAFIEALYAGLPVVTTALGAALEIVDSSCGELVPAGNPSVLAGALARFISSPDERLRLGNAGPARARQLCAVQVQLQRLNDLLVKISGRAA